MSVQRFHGSIDAKSPVPTPTTMTVSKNTTQKRELSYRFYPHFHPYLAELVRRLIEKSVPGLQAADTEYVPNSDGTLVVLPDSTLVALAADLEITLSSGDKLNVSATICTSAEEVSGINNQAQLAEVERIYARRQAETLMQAFLGEVFTKN